MLACARERACLRVCEREHCDSAAFTTR
jgi:hypothetical protein